MNDDPIAALAAGTLLYVAFVEVLMREKSRTNVNGMLQMVCLILGFLTMLTIDLLGRCQHRSQATVPSSQVSKI